MSGIQCPFCGAEAYAEMVDIGVGWQQVAPAECLNCGATQDNRGHWMTLEEMEQEFQKWLSQQTKPSGNPL